MVEEVLLEVLFIEVLFIEVLFIEVVLLEEEMFVVVLLGPKSLKNSFSIVEYDLLSANSKVSFLGDLSLVYI